MSDVLDGLNDEQVLAATYIDGPLMIVAGAGTGKTTVMTRRIAWLIGEGLAKADEILALTFTDKAAKEMEERVDVLLPYGYVDLWISTFHAFCERILREDGMHIGLSSDNRLLTEVDTWLLMRQNLERFDLDYYRPLGDPTKYLRHFVEHFSRAKDDGVFPADYLANVEGQSNLEPDERARLMELAGAYGVYEDILNENNVLDFGGLLLHVLRLFRDRPSILKKYQEQFKYIIVDEFQDTNVIQYEIVKLLSTDENRVAVVGDDDQGIYLFRGASVQNILDFEKDFSNVKHVVLTKNYRSLQPILDASYDFVAGNNPHRLEVSLSKKHGLSKKLEAQKVGDHVIEHIHADSFISEVKLVVQKIVELKAETGCDWSDIALLARSNSSLESFVEALHVAGVPYNYRALSGLYRKEIVMDVIALMRVIDRPYDSVSLFRLFSHPDIGIPEGDLVYLSHEASKSGKSMFEAIEDCSSGFSEDGLRRVREWEVFFTEIREFGRRRNALEVLAKALKMSGLYGTVVAMDEGRQMECSQDLQAFYERVRRFVQISEHMSLHEFLIEFERERDSGEEGDLAQDLAASPDEVQVMTMHGSKGLEFRFVFIVSLVDRKFPLVHKKDLIAFPEGLLAKDKDDLKEAHLREERRLMYVAMTRAKERLFYTSAADYGGKRGKKLSKFLFELGYETPADPLSVEHSFLDDFDSEDRIRQIGVNVPVPKRFSFSQLTSYDKCPLQYKFKNILNIPVFGSHRLSFGNSMHKTLEEFYKLWMERSGDGLRVSLEELLELYEKYFIDEWYQDREHFRKYKAQGREQLTAYYGTLSEHIPAPLFLERSFTVKIEDIVIKGKIDRIDELDGGVEIIDYKTGSPKTRKTISKDDKMQLLVYQMAAMDIFGMEPKRLTFYYLSDQSQVSFLGTEDDLVKLREGIREAVDGIRSRRFDPDPGFSCSFCDYRDICPFRGV